MARAKEFNKCYRAVYYFLILLVLTTSFARAEPWPSPAAPSGEAPAGTTDRPPASKDAGTTPNITVSAPFPNRQLIDLDAGTSTYRLTDGEIDAISQGENTSFNQVLVHAPGVSDDTYGAIHFREEDPYYLYSINGTLLPGGINGFSQDIDTRFVQSVTLKVGALSALYPEGNYGIVDIQTKTGDRLKGGEVSTYGGSFDTLHPSFSYGDSVRGTDFYFTGSYVHNNLGLENPTPSTTALHDETNQYRGFLYVSHSFENSGRLTFVVSGADADYQIPNTPGQATPFDFSGTTIAPTPVDSATLNERQNEQTYYGFVAYQQSIDDFSFQLSQVNSEKSILFNPDVNGDLYFNGVAARVDNNILTNGVQGDFTYSVTEADTIRGGVLADTEGASADDTTTVYPVDGNGNPTGVPETFQDDHFIRGYNYAIYLENQWKVTKNITVNGGLRFEQVKAYTDQSQFSPRINAVYQVDDATAVHAGYARYFDPPQLLNVSAGNVSQFDNTTQAADQDTDSPVRAERSNYFDAGVEHRFLPGLQTGVDGYYEYTKNQIDDGQFGAANIGSPYNFGSATIYGVEFSADYTQGDFSAYGNFAAANSWAKDIVSSQFEFDANELAAIDSNNIHLDQTQYYTASAGVSYRWLDTIFHADAIYGDGIRDGFVNQGKLQPYYPVNCGIEHTFKNLGGKDDLTIRFDVTNLFDQVYVLNDGTGIGEGAVRYGNRRGFFGGLSWHF